MQKNNVVVLDIKMGNVFSVIQACQKVGLEVTVSAKTTDLENADGIIIPGVGAFATAMDYMNKHGLTAVIKKLAQQGKPIFGICLGMQLLLSESEEFGSHQGLNLIPGKVKAFPKKDKEGNVLKTPLISWRAIGWQNNSGEKEMKIFQKFRPEEYLYFVHSYYCELADESMISSTTTYGGYRYAASLSYKNIFATQFHPEKSASKGLEIYKNWAAYIKQYKAG